MNLRVGLREIVGILSLAVAVCAAALVWAIGDRSRQSLDALGQAVRPNLLIVRVNPQSGPAGTQAFARLEGQVGLLSSELERLRRLPGVEAFAVRGQSFFVTGQRFRIVQQTASANLAEVLGLPLEQGCLLTPEEDALGLPFAVIGPITAKEYFGEKNPVGGKISTGLGTFRVVGVLKALPPDLAELRSLDAAMLVPSASDPGASSSRRVGAASTVFVNYAPGKGEQVLKALQAQLESMPIAGLYTVQTPRQWLGAPQVFRLEVARGLGQAVAWTVLLALLAAGANLANLFMLRVLGRQRELALRRTVGATRVAIFRTVAGDLAALGLFGSLLGILTARALGATLPSLFALPSTAVLLHSTLGGAGVTFLAALLPTLQALRLAPAVALREPPTRTVWEGIGLSGLVLGTATLLASVAVSEGSAHWVTERIRALGGQRVVFTTITGPFDQIRSIRPKPPVGEADLKALIDPAVQRKALVGLDVGRWQFAKVAGNAGIVSLAYTVGPYFDFAARPLLTGRYPQKPGEVAMGADAVKIVFPNQSFETVLDQTVRLERRFGSGERKVRVVGIFAGGPWQHFGDLNGDTLVAVHTASDPPLSSLQRDLHLELRENQPFALAVKRLEAWLSARYPGGYASASAAYPAGDLEPIRKTLLQTAAGYRATAGVMLLIGALGLVNLMLVRVNRRRAEVGIRRAVGATRWKVARGFLLESVVLGLVGGSIGCVLGVGTALAVGAASPWPAQLEGIWFVLALGVAALVAGVAGGYPAWLASRLSPIEALRARE